MIPGIMIVPTITRGRTTAPAMILGIMAMVIKMLLERAMMPPTLPDIIQVPATIPDIMIVRDIIPDITMVPVMIPGIMVIVKKILLLEALTPVLVMILAMMATEVTGIDTIIAGPALMITGHCTKMDKSIIAVIIIAIMTIMNPAITKPAL